MVSHGEAPSRCSACPANSTGPASAPATPTPMDQGSHRVFLKFLKSAPNAKLQTLRSFFGKSQRFLIQQDEKLKFSRAGYIELPRCGSDSRPPPCVLVRLPTPCPRY